MLGKTSKPVIEILTGSLVSGYREVAGITPRGLKGFDFGGVGLGIVAALEKSGGGDRSDNKALFGRNLTRSNPIPVKNPWRHRRSLEEMERDSLEEYTIVTCHDPNKTCTTKVYSEAAAGGRKGDGRAPFRIQSCSRATVFDISPASCSEGCGGVPGPDFLSSCNLCHKKLHGKDIYMYRGEKAFCSTECRYRQMVVDERTEKCSSEASRGVVEVGVGVAGSPCKAQIFTKGILAV